MQRDVKIGLAIGILIIGLVAVFWWAQYKSDHPDPAPEGEVAGDTDLPMDQTDLPGSPIGGTADLEGILDSGTGPVGTGASAPGASDLDTAGSADQEPSGRPPQIEARTHVIRQGDTLTRIAIQHYGSERGWKRILEANKNKISDPRKLKIDVRIIIPPALTGAITPAPGSGATSTAATSSANKYTVQAGDSLSKIAKHHYGSEGKWKLILKANRDRISDPDRLDVGMILILPPL